MIKDNFFDRKNYLETLKKRVLGIKDNYRQNIAIVGDEFIGKTSVIFKFLNNFCDNRIITLYLEARNETPESFAKRFIGILLYNFLLNSGIPLKEEIDYLIKKSQRYIPRTNEKIKMILNTVSKGKRNNLVTDLFGLCELINLETSKSCVVILDEFHNLENLKVKNLYREWSKLLLLQKNTMYIIVSSRIAKTKAILAKDLSLLFGNFEIIQLEPFDIKTTGQYLQWRLEGPNQNKESAFAGINLDIHLRNFIVHFSGGCPFYLNLICDALDKQRQTQLADILEGLLFESSGILNIRFSQQVKQLSELRCGNEYTSVLYLVSCGKNRIKDIAHLLKKPQGQINAKINQLLEFDVITRNGDFLKITDRVFGFWLKFVYQEKLLSLNFDDKNQKKKFREYIEKMTQDFFLDAQKSVVQRLLELLPLFGDETLQIDTKRLRLNHFREIKRLEFNSPQVKDGLMGRSGEGLWIMGFKPGSLKEEDIAEFSRECKKYRHKLQRNIIVTLQDIDTNTRLRALEEKILTWDIQHLNQLLEIFSKPWVVI